MVRKKYSTMESSLNPDSLRNSTQTENTARTRNRTIRDTQKSINDQFNADIITFMVNKYPGRQMNSNSQKKER